ncbi:unnamed protein product [Prunus armeniaca]
MSSISCPLSAIPPVPRSADFVGRVYDHLSSLLAPWPVVPVSFIGAQSHSCPVSFKLKFSTLPGSCLGVLLNCRQNNPYAHIRDNMASLPILLKVFNCQEVGDGTDFLFTFCPKLFSLSLEAIMKTQSDDFRLNFVDSERSVSPRAPVWYWPKALRCLSKYGFSKFELQINRQCASFDVGLWTSVVGLPRVEGGVPQVLLREFSEGDLKLSSEGNVILPFGNPVGGRGSTLALPLLFVQRLTLVKSEGRVEWTGEGTSERFNFRASRAVSPP